MYIFIVDLKTVVDFVKKESDFHQDTKEFFSIMAYEKIKPIPIKEYYCFISKPVEKTLSETMERILQGKSAKEIEDKLEVLELINAGVYPDPFELDMEHRSSVFELAKLLNDEIDIDVIIVSNDPKMRDLRKELIKKSPDYNIKIIDTKRWVDVFVPRKNK